VPPVSRRDENDRAWPAGRQVLRRPSPPSGLPQAFQRAGGRRGRGDASRFASGGREGGGWGGRGRRGRRRSQSVPRRKGLAEIFRSGSAGLFPGERSPPPHESRIPPGSGQTGSAGVPPATANQAHRLGRGVDERGGRLLQLAGAVGGVPGARIAFTQRGLMPAASREVCHPFRDETREGRGRHKPALAS
jgi:hypothetical protein